MPNLEAGALSNIVVFVFPKVVVWVLLFTHLEYLGFWVLGFGVTNLV
jgi:hypothetical protein